MASSHSLAAAIFLATLASLLFRASLQAPPAPVTSSVGSSSDNKTSHRASGPGPGHSRSIPAGASPYGVPVPPASPPPPPSTTEPKRPSPAGTSLPPTPLSVESNDFRRGKTLGIILIAAVGALQAVVAVFLLVKRKQMLKMVRSYDMNGWNDAP